ncbi:hypothetical protein [Microbispora amethystogenes]|uniref:Uncharacterized protein n=1 Tax=Microbispora amethystogenes TaxID=1427754 RepID=A0ABQ4FQ88_9ACTN|nr:hypothetical protein [Microbispora amethystogenes]GIH36976.1 hypothetical protein Mam01_71400 [Microbispora amethystogenes]
MRLRWLSETRRTPSVRHTCEECLALSVELCAAGGLMFIRRTDRTHSKPQVRETEWLITCGVRDLWRDLLTGCAR